MYRASKLASCTAAFLAAWLLSFSLARCAGHQLTPEQQATLDLFECRVAALQPFVGSIYDTADLVRQHNQSKLNLGELLVQMGYEQPEILAALVAWKACEPVVAPPPQPGGKVL